MRKLLYRKNSSERFLCRYGLHGAHRRRHQLHPGRVLRYGLQEQRHFHSRPQARGQAAGQLHQCSLHFSFGTDIGSGLRFFAYAGPSASIAVASKIISGSTTYDRLQDNDSLQRFDVMLGAGVGLQFNDMIRFQVGYDMGMLNRYNSSNYTVKRNQLTAGLAFLF
ncbi:MAG: outer membrane beta-barrel protein [Bacteroidales bacterium]|nr:outer membrane beta-barrel protein [Bacteroidales bacterium]